MLWYLGKAILDCKKTPTKEVGSSPTQRLMSGRTKTQLPTASLTEASRGN